MPKNPKRRSYPRNRGWKRRLRRSALDFAFLITILALTALLVVSLLN